MPDKTQSQWVRKGSLRIDMVEISNFKVMATANMPFRLLNSLGTDNDSKIFG